MGAIFEKLEVEKARVHNLPDSEFTDAYLAYRRKVEETIKSYTDYLNVMKIPVGDGIAYILLKLMDLFDGSEGSGYTPSRDGLTYTLDPAPFMEMMRIIIEKSRPQHNQKFEQESKLTDLNKLKTFASSVVKTIAAYGVSQACGQMYLFKGITVILDSIDPSNSKDVVNIKNSSESVEVKKEGTVIIASYKYSFTGRIDKGCCWDDNLVKLGIQVRVWKFPTIVDLKNEYCRVTKTK